MYNRPSLNRKVTAVTRESLEAGLIPSICPICKQPTKELDIHHWAGARSRSIKEGHYRRMCPSCNSVLGRIFRNRSLPINWEDQLFELYRTLEASQVECNEEEGWWSLLTEGELATLASLSKIKKSNKEPKGIKVRVVEAKGSSGRPNKRWNIYLLDKDSWDRERKRVVLCRSKVEAPNGYLAKKVFLLQLLKIADPLKVIPFRNILPYCRVRQTKFRRTKEGAKDGQNTIHRR